MPAGNFTLYNSAKLNAMKQTLEGATLAMALLKPGYTPSATHSTWADVSAQEITDTDYEQQAVANGAFTEASGTVTFDTDDVSFGTDVSITAKYAVIVLGTAGSLQTTDKLVGYLDLNTTDGTSTASSTNGNFEVQTPNGIFSVT